MKMLRRCFVFPVIITACLSISAIAFGAESETRFGPVVDRVQDLVEDELDRGILTGVSVALVDDQRIVLAEGFGWADEAKRRPATGQTVYRAGSISKLFTALATMRLVEQGKLDIDKPVSEFWPEFRIVDPFKNAEPVTLRQLMCHRSGLVRESPVGGYFDPREPSISETVVSLADCVRVHRPNKVTKYSNVGVTVLGHVVAQVSGEAFADHQRLHLLGPLGMKRSSFLRDDRVRPNVSNSYMLVADGQGGFRRIESPVFELGTLPAGNLYASAEDLGRFLSFLFAEGSVDGKQIVKPETIAQMFTPQLTEEESGFGLGFHVDKFRDHKLIGHTGAVYGFSSSLTGIPELKVGVIVMANEDLALGPVRKIADAALGWMVDARLGAELAEEKKYEDVSADVAKELVGDYESESYWAELRYGEGRLLANISGQKLLVRLSGNKEFVVDGRWKNNLPIEFQRDKDGSVIGFESDGQTYRRVNADSVPEIPAAWERFLGSFGPEFIPLVISVKHGHLYAMAENMLDYRLTPMNRTVFKLPTGLYENEQLVFQVGPDGHVHSVILAGMVLERIDP